MTMAILLISVLLFCGGCASQDDTVDSEGHRWHHIDTGSNGKIAVSDSAQAEIPELTEAADISDYLAYAALNNPGLEAAFNRWKAAMEKIPQVTALPDPRFNYRYFVEQVETRVGAQKQAFGISQMFPWFGKLALRGDAASDAAAAAMQLYEAAKLKLFFQVKDAYYEYYYLWRAIGIVRENIRLMRDFERIARARYRAAVAAHPAVIRAQVELGKLEDRLKSLQDLQDPIRARLNAALNRDPEASVPWPKQIAEEGIAATDRQILAWMDESNPRLKALGHHIARTAAQIDLAKKDYYPDVTFGLDFIDTSDRTGSNPPADSGQDAVIAMFSMNLPVWREKLSAGVRQARHEHLAAVRDRTEKANDLDSQMKLALYRFRDAQRKIDLFRDTLLPKAVESVKASEASFRAGDGGFLDLVDAQRVMLEFELAYEDALSQSARKLAEIEMLAGRQMPRAESGQSSGGGE